MMRWFFVALLFAPGLARAQGAILPPVTPVYTKNAQLTPLGVYQYSLSGTAVTVATMAGGSIPAGAVYAIVTPETNAVRWRDDGTAPTASVGFPLAVAQNVTLSELQMGSVQFIAQTGTATVDIWFGK